MAAQNELSVVKTQLADYAFNIHGWAVRIPEDIDQDKLTYLMAYEPSSTRWTKAAENAQKAGEDPLRKSLQLTAQELGQNIHDSNVKRYLLVGLAYLNLPTEMYSRHPQLKKQKPVGIDLLDQITAPDSTSNFPNLHNELAVMVVTQVLDTERDGMILHALLNPKQGLCTPFIISHKSVFYLPMFRDATTDAKSRGPSWNNLVRPHTIFNDSQQNLSAKQENYEKAHNTSNVVLDPNQSLNNGIMSLVAKFAVSHEPLLLREFYRLLEDAVEDLKFQPPAVNYALRKLLDNEEKDWNQEDSNCVVEEFHTLWPDTEKIDAGYIGIIKQHLLAQDLFVPYRLLRPFLLKIVYELSAVGEKSKITHDTYASMFSETVVVLEGLMNFDKTTVPIVTPKQKNGDREDENACDLLMTATITRLEDIVTKGKAFYNDHKDSAGDQANIGAIHDVWEEHARSGDSAAAKLALFKGFRHLVAVSEHLGQDLSDALEEVIAALHPVKEQLPLPQNSEASIMQDNGRGY